MAKRLSNPFAALRRRRTLFGLALAWLFVAQTILGGLAMARLLPERHVAALTGQSLCQPGESGAPAAPDHDHRDCQACPHLGTGAALPPEPAAVIARPAPHAMARALIPLVDAPAARPNVRSAGPRAPPARA